MEAAYPSLSGVPVRLLADVPDGRWRRCGEALGCMSVMTVGLWVDLYRARYPTLSLCSADASLQQKLATHLALLPASCLAMYTMTIFVLAASIRAGRARAAACAAGDALLVTAQIVAAAVIMDMPVLAFAGDGYLRAWVGMAVAMAGTHAGKCGIRLSGGLLRGNDDGRS